MLGQKKTDSLEEKASKWQAKTQCFPERQEAAFVTTSGVPIERLYTPADVADMDYLRKIRLLAMTPEDRAILTFDI